MGNAAKIFLFCLLFTLLFFIHRGLNESDKASAPGSAQVFFTPIPKKKVEHPPGVKELAVEPTKLLKATTPKSRENCKAEDDRIASISASRFAEDLTTGSWVPKAECLNIEGWFNYPQTNLLEICPKSNDAAVIKACLAAAFLTRARIIDLWSGKKQDWKTVRLSILVNQLVSRLTDPNVSASEREETVELARTLVEREPNFFGAQKALVAAYALAGRFDTKLEEALAAGLKANPEDEQLLEMSLFQKTNRGPEGLDEVRAFVDQNPNLGFAHYALARAYWVAGDRRFAKRELQKAIELTPNEGRFKTTLDAMGKSEKTGTKIFILAFSSPFAED